MLIHIIGCGVIGLTTAVCLQEEGHLVRIYTKDFPEQTVSAIAAAIWMPFKVEPVEAVNRWSRISYERFRELAEVPSTGVSMVNFLTLANGEKEPDWLKAMPSGTFRKALPEELPSGYVHGWMTHVPMIETPVYLPFLLEKFRSQGGELVQQEVKNMEDWVQDAAFLVNCTGLGAGRLSSDTEVFPIRGQILKVEYVPGLKYIADEKGPNSLAYILPRKDCIILGGTVEAGNDDVYPDPETARQILRRCSNQVPELKHAKVITSVAGLRPGRTAIRLEHESSTRIIHNYGHGGGGYTVSWGCAEAVKSMIVC